MEICTRPVSCAAWGFLQTAELYGRRSSTTTRSRRLASLSMCCGVSRAISPNRNCTIGSTKVRCCLDRGSAGSVSQTDVSNVHPPQESGELQRRLNSRQLSMIAIGGAIGVGLFLGSSVTIALAGPGIIISYLIGALIAVVMAYALAEMAVVQPVAGSFGIYAETYLSPWAGFTVRATYGLVQIIAIGAEVTAVAIYFGFWFSHIPGWEWILLVSAALITIVALVFVVAAPAEYFPLPAAVLAYVVEAWSYRPGVERPVHQRPVANRRKIVPVGVLRREGILHPPIAAEGGGQAEVLCEEDRRSEERRVGKE